MREALKALKTRNEYKGKTDEEILEAERQKRIALEQAKPFHTTNLSNIAQTMMDKFTIPGSGS